MSGKLEGVFPLPGFEVTLCRAAAFFVGVMLVGCSPPPPPDRPVVVVSVPPQAFFVERIAGELVSVVVMVPGDADPATYSPTIQQVQALSRAALYVKVGHTAFPFERTWLDPMIANAPEIRVVDGSEGVSCPGDDPHIWLAPTAVRKTAASLAAALEAVLPEHRDLLRANLRSFLDEIEAVDGEIRDALQDYAGSKFLVFHPSWGCFAETYGIEQIAIEHDGKEPSTRELAALIDLARAEGIRVVFVQPQFSSFSAETVAEAIGGRIEAIDPLAAEWAKNLRSVATSLRASFDASPAHRTGRKPGR